MRFYTGIGSRETPKEIRERFTVLAGILAAQGWTLRSGGAPGADTAFEEGAPENMRRIYLPWSGFSDRVHGQKGWVDPSRAVPKHIYQQAVDLASRLHPGWHNLKPAVKKLMTRNVFQVLGDDLNAPSPFLWCWAPLPVFKQDRIVDVNGGTGQAVRLAAQRGVRVYNAAHLPHLQILDAYIEKFQVEMQVEQVSQANSMRRL